MDRRPDEGAWWPEGHDRPTRPGGGEQPGGYGDYPASPPPYPGYGGNDQGPSGGSDQPGYPGPYERRPDQQQPPPPGYGPPPGGYQEQPGGYPGQGGYGPPPGGYQEQPGGYPGQGGYGPPPGGGYGAGPGWRPQQKAGNERTGPLPLHPMNIGDILDGIFKLLKANFRTLILVTAVFVVPLNLLSAWSSRRVSSPGFIDLLNDPLAAQTTSTDPFANLNLPVLIVTGLLGLIVTPLVAGVVSRVVASSYLGTQLTAGQALRGTVRYFPALVVAFILVHLCEAVGLLACFIGALFVMPLFMVTSPAIVIEDMSPGRGMIRGLSRSVELTTSRYWPVLGIALLSGLIASALNAIVSFPFSALVGLFGSVPWPLTAAVSVIAELVTTPLITIAAVLVYFDLRIRREGFDLQMLAAGLDGGQRRGGAAYGGPGV